jgi:hypothetical protein
MNDISEGVAFGDLPALRDFMVSPGFTGAAVLVAVIIAVAALLYASGRSTRKQLEQQQRLHEQDREDEQRAARIARCWDQLWRLVDKAEIDPAAHVAEEAMMGVGPEMAAELLRGLLRDAEELGDDTLTATIRTYLAKFALVLTQQGGPLDNGQAVQQHRLRIAKHPVGSRYRRRRLRNAPPPGVIAKTPRPQRKRQPGKGVTDDHSVSAHRRPHPAGVGRFGKTRRRRCGRCCRSPRH